MSANNEINGVECALQTHELILYLIALNQVSHDFSNSPVLTGSTTADDHKPGRLPEPWVR